jgi:hypothetical protein
MANSTQQARNIDGSLALNGQPIPPGPVLLVDDMVDSRWTLTVAAWLLRKSGSGEFGRWPFHKRGTTNDASPLTQHPGDPAADGAADRRTRHCVIGSALAW